MVLLSRTEDMNKIMGLLCNNEMVGIREMVGDDSGSILELDLRINNIHLVQLHQSQFQTMEEGIRLMISTQKSSRTQKNSKSRNRKNITMNHKYPKTHFRNQLLFLQKENATDEIQRANQKVSQRKRTKRKRNPRVKKVRKH